MGFNVYRRRDGRLYTVVPLGKKKSLQVYAPEEGYNKICVYTRSNEQIDSIKDAWGYKQVSDDNLKTFFGVMFL